MVVYGFGNELAKELCHDVMDKSITEFITVGKINSTRDDKDVISSNNDDK